MIKFSSFGCWWNLRSLNAWWRLACRVGHCLQMANNVDSLSTLVAYHGVTACKYLVLSAFNHWDCIITTLFIYVCAIVACRCSSNLFFSTDCPLLLLFGCGQRPPAWKACFYITGSLESKICLHAYGAINCLLFFCCARRAPGCHLFHLSMPLRLYVEGVVLMPAPPMEIFHGAFHAVMFSLHCDIAKVPAVFYTSSLGTNVHLVWPNPRLVILLLEGRLNWSLVLTQHHRRWTHFQTLASTLFQGFCSDAVFDSGHLQFAKTCRYTLVIGRNL